MLPETNLFIFLFLDKHIKGYSQKIGPRALKSATKMPRICQVLNEESKAEYILQHSLIRRSWFETWGQEGSILHNRHKPRFPCPLPLPSQPGYLQGSQAQTRCLNHSCQNLLFPSLYLLSPHSPLLYSTHYCSAVSSFLSALQASAFFSYTITISPSFCPVPQPSFPGFLREWVCFSLQPILGGSNSQIFETPPGLATLLLSIPRYTTLLKGAR